MICRSFSIPVIRSVCVFWKVLKKAKYFIIVIVELMQAKEEKSTA